MGGGKCLIRPFYQIKSLKAFTMLTNLDYFMNAFQTKPIKLSPKSVLTES